MSVRNSVVPAFLFIGEMCFQPGLILKVPLLLKGQEMKNGPPVSVINWNNFAQLTPFPRQPGLRYPHTPPLLGQQSSMYPAPGSWPVSDWGQLSSDLSQLPHRRNWWRGQQPAQAWSTESFPES